MDHEKHSIITNLWDDKVCEGFSEEQLLQYRSNLLGADLRVTNYGGGNTSAKIITKDLLTGGEVEVLWVKGSGGDLGSMKLDGFATLYMEELNSSFDHLIKVMLDDNHFCDNEHLEKETFKNIKQLFKK